MFDSEYFIQCIQKHPSIWEIGSAIYMDKDVKERSWNTVGEMMFSTWGEKTNAEKEEKVKMMKVKWRHIRDCYGKFLNKRKSGEPLKKKKYVYADDLDFLTPIVLKRISRTQSFAKVEVEIDNTSSLEESTPCIVQEKPSPIKKPTQVSPVHPKVHKPQGNNNLQNQPSSKTDVQKAQEKDADRAFLLSLLPDFRKLNDDQKLDFRFHALQFFRDIRRGHRSHQNSNYGPSSFPHPYFLMPFPPEYMRNQDFSSFFPHYLPPSTQQHFTTSTTTSQQSSQDPQQGSHDQKSSHIYSSDDSMNSIADSNDNFE